ncbi:17181_t:CDS:2 [Entrophospora sp. SA101]|nr:8709_t:CDS:2 [Entrophospora sp. SA101]CAJ0629879.1 5671_t:CDS:2 [Entrophospora sp. SA101]CAJ0751414.1 17181_t:CDS:2 [Entrophospora sp. SA101]CAJ0832374.1 4319_t:CDS:2 [Entrophospora sp. SA101]CAJ0865465.1 4504_t:CDS:2 [Entrophospora sp. SA101]
MSSNCLEDQNEDTVDERVQEVLDKITETNKSGTSEEDLDDEKLFEELENDDFDLTNLREKRMEQLKQEMEKLKEMRQNDHGSYVEIDNEKEILKITTSTNLCVVHFFHKDFRRCQIMDKHLKTKFVKINVENSPFLIEKLNIQILPCVISFIDGISVDRIIGFEDLGNTDSFTTAALEFRLSQCGNNLSIKTYIFT